MGIQVVSFPILGLLTLLQVTSATFPLGVEFTAPPFLFTDAVYQLSDGGFRNAANTSEPATTDENGWPTQDTQAVLFDLRCVGAWAPPPDDPWCWQAPLNGTWYYNLTGNATVTVLNGKSCEGITLSSEFDPITFTTAGTFGLAPGAPDLVILKFTNTKRNASAPINSGFLDLRILLPGRGGDVARTWAPQLINAIAPFDHFRFMGITGTNTNPGYYGDPGHHYLDFWNRCLPSDAVMGTGPNRPGCWGLPWEYVVQVAQATGKGIWVNTPVSATVDYPVNTSSYVFAMAQLMYSGNAWTSNEGVPESTAIYIEHSNEVWNYGFGQYIWNKLAAIDECNSTTHPEGCLWNNDGINDSEIWAQRRHIGKVFQIGQTFAAVFGAHSVPTRIRPIYADWTIFPDRYNSTLAWFNSTYGWPAKYLYGMACTAYYGIQPSANEPIAAIYAGYINNSLSQLPSRKVLVQIAGLWGLKLVAYEAGPGWNVGNNTDVGNAIIAQRQEEMRTVVKNDVLNSWIPAGGAEYNAFSLGGYYSRYGQWGSFEQFFNISTPRYCGLMDLIDAPLPPGC